VYSADCPLFGVDFLTVSKTVATLPAKELKCSRRNQALSLINSDNNGSIALVFDETDKNA